MPQAVYPGSFDPITRGHLDLIDRGIAIFNRIIVAVLSNPKKSPLFTHQERVEMIRDETSRWGDRIIVESFDGLLVEYMKTKKANVVLRGLRAVSDFEYELEMALTNRQLADEIETVFLTPSVEYVYLRASTVKTVARGGGDISPFVTPSIEKRVLQRYAELKSGKTI